MVSRDSDQFKLKQTQGSCIVFSYCLIMSHFTDKEPFEIMIDFVNDFKERSSNPTCTSSKDFGHNL